MTDECKRILITRNHSLSRVQANIIVTALAIVLATIAMAFYSQGAWMVLPFAGCEFLAVAAGFYVCVRHNNDYELVEIDSTNIRVKRITVKSEQHFYFQTYWTTIMLEATKGWHPSKLWVKSKGEQVELGQWLTESERNRLAKRLKKLV